MARRWRDFAPLGEGERSDILRAAIAMRSPRRRSPRSVAREIRAKMADGTDRRAFDVVSAPIGTGGKEFPVISPGVVASVDTLDTFLRDLRARSIRKRRVAAGDKMPRRPPCRPCRKSRNREDNDGLGADRSARRAPRANSRVHAENRALRPVALDQRAGHQAPAVHQHEEDQLDGNDTTTAATSSCPSTSERRTTRSMMRNGTNKR